MRWTVTTDASLHVLDFREGTYTRHPNEGAFIEPAILNSLRKDGESVPLLAVSRCQIGEPMALLIDVRGDGVDTVRLTTPVRAISGPYSD